VQGDGVLKKHESIQWSWQCIDDLEEVSVRMVAPQVVDELDVESHEEVSHSREKMVRTI
jgi:hypothetical protein